MVEKKSEPTKIKPEGFLEINRKSANASKCETFP